MVSAKTIVQMNAEQSPAELPADLEQLGQVLLLAGLVLVILFGHFDLSYLVRQYAGGIFKISARP